MGFSNPLIDELVTLKMEKEKLATNSPVFRATLKLVEKRLEELNIELSKQLKPSGETPPSFLPVREYMKTEEYKRTYNQLDDDEFDYTRR